MNKEFTDVEKALAEMEAKYERLVWYARSPRATSVDFWIDVPDEIRNGAFQCQMEVEEEYPDEVSALRDRKAGEWQHGFNSGVLAALRYVYTAQMKVQTFEDESGEWSYGGLEDATENFPDLCT